MEITPSQLIQQWESVPPLVQYVWLVAESRAQMPKYMLAAVASRETNMSSAYWQGTVGDGGHGHGSFQLDDRFHIIARGFDKDPNAQAQTAAQMLSGLHRQFGNWPQALAAYNSGTPYDWNTTHHDYAADTFARYLVLFEHYDTARVLRLTSPYMIGKDVSFWQMAMNGKHYRGTPLQVDGVYGPKTAAVVGDFQFDNRLPITSALDPLTLAEMAAT